MMAFVVLLLAALSRFLPHTLHGVGLNITAVGGGLLFFGSRQPRWQCILGAAAMAGTDIILTLGVYHYPFHLQDYAVTWSWYAAICLIGSAALRQVTVLRVAGAVLASATGFFLLSNLVVWMEGSLYARTADGLVGCYAAALPFYGNDLVSTALTAGVLFGLPVLAARIVREMSSSAHQGQPLL